MREAYDILPRRASLPKSNVEKTGQHLSENLFVGNNQNLSENIFDKVLVQNIIRRKFLSLMCLTGVNT